MFLTVKRLALFLTFLAQAVAQVPSIGGGSSGGASAINDLTDVTITSGADGDGLRHNGTAFVNTALFTAGTSDILAARMSANWGTAGTSACATSGGVMFDNASTVGCDADLQFNGQSLTVGATAGGMTSAYQLNFGNSGSRAGIYGVASGGSSLRFTVFNGVQLFQLGGSQTALIQNQTATTGDTLFIVRRGAGESGNVFEVNWGAAALDKVAVSSVGTLVGQTNSGGIKYQLVLADSTFRLASDNHIKFNSTTTLSSGALDTGITRSSAGVMKITDASTGYGSIDAAAYRLAGTGAIIHPPSATEPVDCTTSNDGSMYFDTTDQTMCVCANDGADEWQKITDMTTDCSI